MTLINPPRLICLCYEAVYQNKEKLRGYGDLLPRRLTQSLYEYIIDKAGRIHYMAQVVKYPQKPRITFSLDKVFEKFFYTNFNFFVTRNETLRILCFFRRFAQRD